MSDLDELIACLANEVQCTSLVEEACQKTINDYQSCSTQGDAGPGLKMIAWDRS